MLKENRDTYMGILKSCYLTAGKVMEMITVMVSVVSIYFLKCAIKL